jgi:hypothetical protein
MERALLNIRGASAPRLAFPLVFIGTMAFFSFAPLYSVMMQILVSKTWIGLVTSSSTLFRFPAAHSPRRCFRS